MFVVDHFFSALASVVSIALTTYMWIIIIRALLSWVNPDPYNPIVQFIYRITEPVLRPIRSVLPTYQLGLDLSPMVAILVIYFLQMFLVPVLRDIGRLA